MFKVDVARQIHHILHTCCLPSKSYPRASISSMPSLSRSPYHPLRSSSLCAFQCTTWHALQQYFATMQRGHTLSLTSSALVSVLQSGLSQCSRVACIVVRMIMNEKSHNFHSPKCTGEMQRSIALIIRTIQICLILNE